MKIRVELTEDLTRYGEGLVEASKDMLLGQKVFGAEIMIILLQ